MHRSGTNSNKKVYVTAVVVCRSDKRYIGCVLLHSQTQIHRSGSADYGRNN